MQSPLDAAFLKTMDFYGYYGFYFVTPLPPQYVERFHRYRSNKNNILYIYIGWLFLQKSYSTHIFHKSQKDLVKVYYLCKDGGEITLKIEKIYVKTKYQKRQFNNTIAELICGAVKCIN